MLETGTHNIKRSKIVRYWAQWRSENIGGIEVNGTLADVLLFGSFLVWAVAGRISMKRRPARPLPGAPESRANDAIVVMLGLALYAAFVIWLHELLMGVGPFG